MSNFWATVCKTVRPMLSVRCLTVCSVCLSVTLVHCGQAVGWIKMKLGMQVGLGPGHTVFDGDPALLPQRGRAPNFRPALSPLPKKRAEPPHLWAHFYCGQMAGCIKVPPGMEVGLSPGDFVLDRDPAPPQKGAKPPIFGPCLLRPNGCMDEDATWYGGRPRPR